VSAVIEMPVLDITVRVLVTLVGVLALAMGASQLAAPQAVWRFVSGVIRRRRTPPFAALAAPLAVIMFLAAGYGLWPRWFFVVLGALLTIATCVLAALPAACVLFTRVMGEGELKGWRMGLNVAAGVLRIALGAFIVYLAWA